MSDNPILEILGTGASSTREEVKCTYEIYWQSGDVTTISGIYGTANREGLIMFYDRAHDFAPVLFVYIPLVREIRRIEALSAGDNQN